MTMSNKNIEKYPKEVKTLEEAKQILASNSQAVKNTVSQIAHQKEYREETITNKE